jgi:hypothetical protein
VEESAAATQVLKDEAVELRRLVSDFRTGTDGASAPNARLRVVATPAPMAPRRPPIEKQRANASAGAAPRVQEWSEF